MSVNGNGPSARLGRRLVVSLFAMIAATASPLLAQDAMPFVVVAHPSVDVDSLSAKEISDLFLKKAIRWRDGTEVVPVDLPSDSRVRASFSEAIHDREVSAIKSYWQRQIFSGRAVPPVEKTSEDEVLDFVRSRRGAIGYVSAEAPVEGLRRLRIRE